jgi:hypothetical protein
MLKMIERNDLGSGHLPVIQANSRCSLSVSTVSMSPIQGMLTQSNFRNFLAKHKKKIVVLRVIYGKTLH